MRAASSATRPASSAAGISTPLAVPRPAPPGPAPPGAGPCRCPPPPPAFWAGPPRPSFSPPDPPAQRGAGGTPPRPPRGRQRSSLPGCMISWPKFGLEGPHSEAAMNTVQELGAVHRRYADTSHRFRAAWTFHQFLQSLGTTGQQEISNAHSLEFQNIYPDLSTL